MPVKSLRVNVLGGTLGYGHSFSLLQWCVWCVCINSLFKLRFISGIFQIQGKVPIPIGYPFTHHIISGMLIDQHCPVGLFFREGRSHNVYLAFFFQPLLNCKSVWVTYTTVKNMEYVWKYVCTVWIVLRSVFSVNVIWSAATTCWFIWKCQNFKC